nr:GxxExxY protein [Echinicola marina]
MPFKQQFPLDVNYEGIIIGNYYADLLVDETVIVELKALKQLESIHTAQLMNYLKACNKRCGLLINFGKPRVEVKRILNGF